MSDNEEDEEEDTLGVEIRRELEKMARTIRERGWDTWSSDLNSLLVRRGIESVYDLGRIVGALQVLEAVRRSVEDGWDAEVALRSRAGKEPRRVT